MPSVLPVGEPAPADGALPADLQTDAGTDFGVYLHVPFCRVRCGYCDFNTYTAGELRGARQDQYADTLLHEISLSRGVLAAAGPLRPAQTVFFGGGTPTLLPSGDLARMLDGVRDTFGIADGAEVTVEANPDTVTPAGVAELARAGVTRLSIGMQSAVAHVLAALDRTHDPDNVATAVAAAREAGLDVSVDLIYGAPGETLADWERSLETAVGLAPDHISAYALIVEEGTKLHRQIRRGEVPAPDDDLQADMYELADETLAAAGFEWYEVSNWARDESHRSRHNLAYWRGTDWWGYGPGAHSHVAGLRWWNVKHPAAYAQRLAAGESPAAGRERPDAASRRLEDVLLRSRIREGLALAEVTPAGRGAVAGLIADGLVDGAAAVHGTLVLTRRGRLLADAVVRALTA
ncbi:radical SAM family heme chaperone HemW [Microbacterium sp. zg.Y1090]|uniref:radical SAM family heme chaperone HemW n=1 Tax=Microbacterium TaxID=33882 RepID=UPI00214B7014|nr:MULTISPECIES: radical SAM family heme chaperone HemW [unclassified Microbacterium]MCR2811772.1 radical SAM family heme chaperone HemW [Microbacterium sp. zg.Y1084]MCR2818790.1 radical SAM family heme chaperone HemW [Microbacterium sp. zg.Y1090]MDL5486880.1 radical SAM family heme chaperone HemW [Microbacterium sp. zg-Y1211]WIM27105.1 radical SAM family heme chaperone HemW [Microbacterium sp. zg-Y1090]